VQDILQLEVADGKISFHTDYFFNLEDLNATAIKNANVAIDNLRIKPKNAHKDILNLGSLRIEGVNAKPMLQDVHVSKIALNSLSVKAVRDANAALDWLAYVKLNMPETDKVQELNASINQEKQMPWNVLVDEIALEKIEANFYDKAINPQVNTKLNGLNLYAKNVTLAGEKPFTYSLDMKLNDAFECASQGEVKHQNLELNASLTCKGFDALHYTPYIDKAAKNALGVYDVQLMKAKLNFDADIELKQENEQMFIKVKKANIGLSNFALNKKSTKERVLDFKSFDVHNLAWDVEKKELEIAKIMLSNLQIQAKRFENGRLNIEGLLEAKKSPKAEKKASKKANAFRIKLKHLGVEGAQVLFHDGALSPNVKTKVDQISLNLYDVDSQEQSWLAYKLSLRINAKGVARSDGKIRHSPLKQKGTFDMNGFSLKEFTPYLGQKMYLKIQDGAIDAHTKISYEASPKKADIALSGAIKLKEFFLADSRDNASLLSVSTLELKAFELDLLPNRLHINEVNIDSFYVDALINEQKIMNFSRLVKEDAQEKKRDANATLAANAPKDSQESFPYKIEKINLKSGSAKFADYSLPIKFQTNIHDLGGSILTISSAPGDVTYVDVVGEVDAYGATKLKGSVESANPKKFTDLDLGFKNLELNAMSGYSASFAGYAIESGKLYLDLGYKIKDSELLGSNSIVIKKIKLGEEIKDENRSSLPLGIVIALLEDNEGVIDIDMPVAGNIDAPDFKYGALVMKTLGNLILKAVASPFTFLGSAMGIEGEKLEYISFEAGKAEILPPQREKLDQIVDMLTKRPKMLLSLSGVYDITSDTKALQLEKLIALCIKKSGAKSQQEQQNAMNIDILKDIYEEIKDDDALDKIEDALKEKYKGDEFKREYLKALVAQNIALQTLTKEELEALAALRAQNIMTYLTKEHKLEAERILNTEIQAIDAPQNVDVRMNLAVEVK
jgi:hypothetical protein